MIDFEPMIIPPDPLSSKSVKQCMDYLMHGRLGEDPDEDKYYIDFFSKALCNELRVPRITIEWNGWKPKQNDEADYRIVMSLVEQLCRIYGIPFTTPEELLGEIAESNARVLTVNAAEAILRNG